MSSALFRPSATVIANANLELPQSMLRDGLQSAFARLARHEQSGLVRVFEDRIVVTEAGRLPLAELCAELDELPLQPRGAAAGTRRSFMVDSSSRCSARLGKTPMGPGRQSGVGSCCVNKGKMPDTCATRDTL